jgi:quinoprotein relay system zinc metallohydrolase 2
MKHWLVVLSALLGAPAAAAELAIEEIAPGNYVHYGRHEERSRANLGDQANIGFIVGERCAAVIDTGGSLPLGVALRTAIQRTTPLPVCYVVLTHVHPDHLFGAAAFRADQPQYVAHAELPRALAARGKFYSNTLQRDLGDLATGSEVVPPTLLVTDRMTLDLGNRKLEVRAWPVAHTDNDLTVYDERSGTLWVSDLLFIDHTPVVDGSVLGYLKAIDVLAQLPARHYVAGHGRSELAWPQVLAPQQRYLQRLVDETRQALRNRQTIQDAVESVGYAEAGNWVNFELFHRRNVTAVYTELEWED